MLSIVFQPIKNKRYFSDINKNKDVEFNVTTRQRGKYYFK